jgi:hypothetical protein
MGLVTWIAIGVIVLVAIGLGVGVFFSGLVRGAQIVSQNPVVKNATSEAGKALTNASTTTLTTTNVYTTTTVQAQKTVYTSSEPVIIVVKNQGSQPVTFPSHTVILKAKNQGNGNTYIVSAAQDKNQLAPGDSLNITWDQRDSNDNLVSSGTYVVDVQENSNSIGTTTITIQQS